MLEDRFVKGGTIRFVKGGHKAKRCLTHHWAKNYLLLEPSEFEEQFGAMETVSVSVKEGGFVIFNNFTPHTSLENTSGTVRWSFDMRYQDSGLPHGMGGDGGVCRPRSKQ